MPARKGIHTDDIKKPKPTVKTRMFCTHCGNATTRPEDQFKVCDICGEGRYSHDSIDI